VWRWGKGKEVEKTVRIMQKYDRVGESEKINTTEWEEEMVNKIEDTRRQMIHGVECRITLLTPTRKQNVCDRVDNLNERGWREETQTQTQTFIT
jgi:hypothetical protein